MAAINALIALQPYFSEQSVAEIRPVLRCSRRAFCENVMCIGAGHANRE